MPMIDLYYPNGALSDAACAEAVEELTLALLRHEGAVDNEATRAMSRAFVHELPADRMFIGGRVVDQPTYRVLLTAPMGTLLHGPGPVGSASREALTREVSEIVLAAEGTEYSTAEAARVFCIIEEIPDGLWGGMGSVFRMDDIVAFSNPDAPQTENSVAARKALAESELDLTRS